MVIEKSEGNAWSDKHYNVGSVNQYDLKPAGFVIDYAPFLSERARTVLDAGCGQGRNSLYLASQGFDVVSVDASKSALSLCGKILQRNGFTPKLVNARLQDLSEVDSIDAVISVTVLTHILDAEEVLDEFYRVLNPEGCVVADFANHNDSTYEDISKGQKIGENAFLEQGTVVVYREREQVERLFDPKKWELVEVKEISFIEPPHPGSRPYNHEHSSYVVVAKKKLPHPQ